MAFLDMTPNAQSKDRGKNQQVSSYIMCRKHEHFPNKYYVSLYQAHENVSNILSYSGSVNLNHNAILPHNY